MLAAAQPRDTFINAARQSLQSLSASKSLALTAGLPHDTQLPPVSFSEAQTSIASRDEEVRKQAAKKDKNKHKTPAPPETNIPGAEPGSESTKSAFWTFVEVSQAASRLGCLHGSLHYLCMDPLAPPVGRHVPPELAILRWQRAVLAHYIT